MEIHIDVTCQQKYKARQHSCNPVGMIAREPADDSIKERYKQKQDNCGQYDSIDMVNVNERGQQYA
jgi:hypothetical protein